MNLFGHLANLGTTSESTSVATLGATSHYPAIEIFLNDSEYTKGSLHHIYAAFDKSEIQFDIQGSIDGIHCTMYMIRETKNILLIKGFSMLTYLSGRDTTLTESKLIDRINLCFLQIL